MKAAAATATAVALEESRAPTARVSSDLLLYLSLFALVAGSWFITRLGWFTAGDDVGYWLGVAGGVMMLLLFSYPLRKYLRFMHGWGKVRSWFVVHMVLGLGGPLLILLHSGFHLRSVNATVAFFSMVVVALSGVAGRFLHVRIHRGLHGERSNLQDLQARAGLAETEMKSRFRFAPEVATALLGFEHRVLANGSRRRDVLRNVVLLPVQQHMVQAQCVRDLNKRLRGVARQQRWSRDMLRRRQQQAAKLTRRYLLSVVKVAQFSTYERLFALWHVLHLPFVYILIVTALFHVFAVHAY